MSKIDGLGTLGTCGTCHHWIGTGQICQVAPKTGQTFWLANDFCNQLDTDNSLKYIGKDMPTLEEAADKIIDEVQGTKDKTCDEDDVGDAVNNIVARSTDRSSDCSTCQPNTSGETEALA